MGSELNTSSSTRSGKVRVETPTGRAVATLINQRSDLRATLRSIMTLAVHKPTGWEAGIIDLATGALHDSEEV